MNNHNEDQEVDVRERIVLDYKDYVLTNGKDPSSVYTFAKAMGLSEADFYSHFNGFEAVDHEIWHSAANRTIEALKTSKEYASYGSREKILGLFYTLIEVLNQERSYYIYSLNHEKTPLKNKEGLKAPIIDFVKSVIDEGLAVKEFEDRKYISEKYHQAVWLNVSFILSFWVTDSSKGFEKTDAAIEKSVNLLVEMMGKSALDSFLDLGKFLFQNRFKPGFKM